MTITYLAIQIIINIKPIKILFSPLSTLSFSIIRSFSIHDASRHRRPMQRDDHGSKSVKAKDIIMVCVTRERLNAELFTFIKFMKRISVLNKTKEYIRNGVLSSSLFFFVSKNVVFLFFSLCTTRGFVLEFSVVLFLYILQNLYTYEYVHLLEIYCHYSKYCLFFSGCCCCCIWNKVRIECELCSVCCVRMKA